MLDSISPLHLSCKFLLDGLPGYSTQDSSQYAGKFSPPVIVTYPFYVLKLDIYHIGKDDQLNLSP